jgi:hypothetical protein
LICPSPCANFKEVNVYESMLRSRVGANYGAPSLRPGLSRLSRV